ncbi:esterase family protein [Aestuariibacter halophilus]|uniref:Esterase family protein n=1 Tax=Fluctibacter halophilus TaxID=226011 RepID=A0ABS8G9R6_9ALTE|nr:alpha/beta hydrolase-fold protein [Aestuariibacter halophilus]MCC2617324.1 esterase family protein [Aestuariibacter halophilus]
MKHRRWFPALFLCAAIGAVSASTLPHVSSGRLVRHNDVPAHGVPERTIDVWLPSTYDGKRQHDVLIMHDGDMLFDARLTWNNQEWQVDEVAGQLIDAGHVRPFIVVAVPNAGAARHAEYFPQQPFMSLTVDTQQALYDVQRDENVPLFAQPVYSDAYATYLVKDVLPYIEQHYAVNTAPSSRILAGSSMGGLISWYTLTRYPDSFGGAICMSTHWPGAMQPQHPAFDAFYTYLQAHLPTLKDKRLYFDYGDETIDAWYPPLQQRIDNLLQANDIPATQWTSRYFAGANHSEQAWAARLDVPLRWMFASAEASATR